jgi:hypothetical protein
MQKLMDMHDRKHTSELYLPEDRAQCDAASPGDARTMRAPAINSKKGE